jgi:hypothetical protein
VVPDNLKAGITKPSRYEPGINRTYQELAIAGILQVEAGAHSAPKLIMGETCPATISAATRKKPRGEAWSPSPGQRQCAFT